MELTNVWPLSCLSRTKDQFALFVVSFFTAKLLHLFSHRASLPAFLIVLYLPTFLCVDLLLLVGSKTLVYRTPKEGRPSIVRKWLGAGLALITAFTSSASLSFYFETGGEIQWAAASNLAVGHGGLGLISSGSVGFLISLTALCCLTWIVSPQLYDLVDYILKTIAMAFRQVYRRYISRHHSSDYQVLDSSLDSDLVDLELSDLDLETKGARQQGLSPTVALMMSLGTVAAVVIVAVLLLVRPNKPPYAHMSGSLPLTVITSFLFSPINSEFCLAALPDGVPEFPAAQFANVAAFQAPEAWSGWLDSCGLTSAEGKPKNQEEWDSTSNQTTYGRYRAACDPLNLSNLEEAVNPDLSSSLEIDLPRIKNVMLITMESTRRDLFPLQKDSEPHKAVLASYSEPQPQGGELDEKLARSTRTSAFLTGLANGFGVNDINGEQWRAAFAPGQGAINVNGAITQSTFTLKSLLTSHCGVEPLPVDFTEEVKGNMYQPCFPHLMTLFNEAEETTASQEETGSPGAAFQSWPWQSALVQSITDKWDSQDILDVQMGLNPDRIVVSSTLTNPSSKHYPPQESPVNYFGYPETETMPYLRDLFLDARENNQRLFVSHVTSTTHHPFAVPDSWNGTTEYFHYQGWQRKDHFDSFLNTIHYQDEWLSEIFAMLHDVGALDETLVVLVGDHGQAFDAPDGTHSTYDNGHISNFNIPLVFVHPHLPRIQVQADTTPLSIIPTVLDLLLQTKSLSAASAEKAKALLPQYQGHSMIRAPKFRLPLHSDGEALSGSAHEVAIPGLEPWHFSIMNPGGSMLAISQARSPYRLILPLCSTAALRFTDLSRDPWERDPLTAWTTKDLASKLETSYDAPAAQWADLAERLGRWWFWQQRQRWNYHLSGKSTDRADSSGTVAGA